MTHRQCAVIIKNNSNNYILQNREEYIYSGYCRDTLPSTIRPSDDGSALFMKTPDTACGSVAVFTYDLYNTSTERVDKKMAVMFSNPYDFTFYSNYYAVGLFERTQRCDYNLFYEMYYNTGSKFGRNGAGSDLTYERDGVIISASMTDTKQPNLDIEVKSRNVPASSLTSKGDGVIISAPMTDSYKPNRDIEVKSSDVSASPLTSKGDGLIISANMTYTGQPMVGLRKKICSFFSCLTCCCTVSPNE